VNNEFQKNANRFLGFADDYDKVRPKCPQYVVDFLISYLGYSPKAVVDLGCGTGLSTVIWNSFSEEVIGIDPNEDMLKIASENYELYKNVHFKKAFSNETGLDNNFADIVTCSQSFHWMEPNSAIKEVSRILKTGGIFAVYDCDWPPLFKYEADSEYETLFHYVNEIEEANPQLKDKYIKWDKDKHLQNIKQSGEFKYSREILFTNEEACNADRYIGLAMSQGGLRGILKYNSKLLEPHLERFINAIKTAFGDKTYSINFCYRMRLGVK
jgi:ubiquinone/menaquinone biosynthesis C-methylase UbiE